MRRPHSPAPAALAALAMLCGPPTAAQTGQDELSRTLALASAQVEEYYARVRTIVSTERVQIQSLRSDFLAEGRSRELEYEWRLEWEPQEAGPGQAVPQISRRLLTVNGRPPRRGDDSGCIDPRDRTPEPLAMFLEEARDQWAFSLAGRERVDGRPAVMVDFKAARPDDAEVVWSEECVSIDVPAQVEGRAWIDAENGDVLRVDERFVGQFDFQVAADHQRRGAPMSMTVERADTSVRYRPVRFSDPDETLLLPASMEALTVVRNAGSPRVRVIHTFENYRRFVTGSRILR